MILYIKAMKTTTTTKTPVQMLIDEFGGLRSLARSISRDPAAVCRWQKSGLVPTNVQKNYLKSSKMNLFPFIYILILISF